MKKIILILNLFCFISNQALEHEAISVITQQTYGTITKTVYNIIEKSAFEYEERRRVEPEILVVYSDYESKLECKKFIRGRRTGQIECYKIDTWQFQPIIEARSEDQYYIIEAQYEKLKSETEKQINEQNKKE